MWFWSGAPVFLNWWRQGSLSSEFCCIFERDWVWFEARRRHMVSVDKKIISQSAAEVFLIFIGLRAARCRTAKKALSYELYGVLRKLKCGFGRARRFLETGGGRKIYFLSFVV